MYYSYDCNPFHFTMIKSCIIIRFDWILNWKKMGWCFKFFFSVWIRNQVSLWQNSCDLKLIHLIGREVGKTFIRKDVWKLAQPFKWSVCYLLARHWETLDTFLNSLVNFNWTGSDGSVGSRSKDFMGFCYFFEMFDCQSVVAKLVFWFLKISWKI